MFKEGQLLCFDPFYFKNGALPKKKYFIVLKNDGGGLLLASLPTSKDHIPSDLTIHAGIYEFPDRGLSAFVFLAGQEVATDPVSNSRFSFPRNTFIYAEQLESYPSSALQNQIDSGLTSISLIGILDKDLFQELQDFFKNSSMVKRKYKKLL